MKERQKDRIAEKQKVRMTNRQKVREVDRQTDKLLMSGTQYLLSFYLPFRKFYHSQTLIFIFTHTFGAEYGLIDGSIKPSFSIFSIYLLIASTITRVLSGTYNSLVFNLINLF